VIIPNESWFIIHQSNQLSFIHHIVISTKISNRYFHAFFQPFLQEKTHIIHQLPRGSECEEWLGRARSQTGRIDSQHDSQQFSVVGMMGWSSPADAEKRSPPWENAMDNRDLAMALSGKMSGI